MTHLDKIKLYGKQLRVMPSKHQGVQMPKEGQPDAGLTKDFVNSSLHRFKKPGSKNYQNIYPPSSTLHLSNIPYAYIFLRSSSHEFQLPFISGRMLLKRKLKMPSLRPTSPLRPSNFSRKTRLPF